MAVKLMLPLCLLISSVIATPIQIRSSPVTLPIAIKINSTGGAQALINKDRARARALFARGQAKAQGKSLADVPVPVTDAATVYSASVGVGDGTYTLIVDTGSSNAWVGADKLNPYKPSAHSQNTGSTVSVSYGSGFVDGVEFIDRVTLGSATIKSQSIGAALVSTGFDGFDGILGIGPVDLTEGTTSDGNAIPTVTDNLKSQGTIDQALVGVSFVPTTPLNDQNGELDFGGVDNSKYTGSISFVPITNTSPAKEYWGIDQSITYGSSTNILGTTAGIVDTGTTLILLASDAFQNYQRATGATLDEATGFLTVSSESSLQSLFFAVGGTTFELTPNAQIWPRELNGVIGGQADQIYLIVNNLGSPSGQGLDFINGFTFLQRFYSVYDTTNSRVGLATTSHTYDTSN